MDILKAILHAKADYLDDSVKKLLASELKRRPSVFTTKPKQARCVERKEAGFRKRHLGTRA